MRRSVIRYRNGRTKKNLKIAFTLVYAGWHEKTWPPAYDEAPLIIAGTKLKRKDIKTYLTAQFYDALRFWRRVKTYGFPYPWTEAAAADLYVVELFDGILVELQAEDRDAAYRRAQSNRRGRS